MPRRNRDKSPEKENESADFFVEEFMDESAAPSVESDAEPEVTKTLTEPAPPPSSLVVPMERTLTLQQYTRRKTGVLTEAFRIERQIQTKFRTERFTKDEWDRLYDEFLTKPRP